MRRLLVCSAIIMLLSLLVGSIEGMYGWFWASIPSGVIVAETVMRLAGIPTWIQLIGRGVRRRRWCQWCRAWTGARLTADQLDDHLAVHERLEWHGWWRS